MTFAYLILAHKNPEQLQRLLKNLQSEKVFFFIHIDEKTDEIPFVELFTGCENIFFCKKRISVNWSGFSVVEATVLLMETMIKQIGIPDYVHLLSGQDFPLKNPEQINLFFKDNSGKNFLEYVPFPKPDWNLGGMDRINFNWFIDRIGVERSYDLNKYQKPKKYIPGIKPYGGSQWWSLTGECAAWLFSQCIAGNEIYDFYRYTLCPDEMFFHTMLLNSHFKDTVINTNLRKIDWSAPGDHPRDWLYNDIELLKKTPKFFARKFDENIDKRVLDELEIFTSQPIVKKETPAISVVMSMYNSEKYLKECIESVLNQTFGDFEFIIVDDGSEDSSVDIVESFNDSRIRLIKKKHDFIDSLNRGMAAAKGEYIAKIDSGDIMMPEKLETQYDYMISIPDIDICGSYVECFGLISKTLALPLKHNQIVSKLLFENPIIDSSVLVKNESIKKNSLCYKNYSEEDYQFWIDCHEAGLKFSIIPKVLLKHRTIDKQNNESYKNEEIMHSSNKIKLEHAQFVAASIVEREEAYTDLLDNLIDLVNKKFIDVSLFLNVLYNINIKLLESSN